MVSSKRKVIAILLEIFLYIILISGILFFLLIFNRIPSCLIKWKLIFIITHKILGYIFGILVLLHCLNNRKWFKAWFSGKIKNTKKSFLTKWISILSLIMPISFSLAGIFPRNTYVCVHTIIGVTWIILMIYHVKAKRSIAKKISQKRIITIS